MTWYRNVWTIFLAYLFQLELRYYKSAVAAEATENGVTILTGAHVLKLYHKILTKIWILAGDNFEQIAMDSKKDVFAA